MASLKTELNRDKWKGRFDFVFVSIGYAVGLGNIWRFPYMCYESGGGAFLIPYFLMLILCGIPLMYLEVSIGQYSQQGPVGAIAKFCPLFKGAGIAAVVITYLFLTYYNVILSWSFYYIFSSFASPLPWTYCDPEWSTNNCWVGVNSTNMTRPNDTVSPAKEFFRNVVLKQSEGLEYPGIIRWELVLLLLLSWIIVYFCVFKGTSSTGRVVYFTATAPYIVLIVMLVRGLTMKGSAEGVLFFVRPKWHLLLNIKVWINAAIQNFNSIGIGFGAHITMSSYNRFHSPILRDVIFITLTNAATSVLSGLVIFSILGHVALLEGKPIENVTTDGMGLVFETYPIAFGSMPGSNFFAVIFFLMLVLLGIDSAFVSLEVVITTLNDHFGKYLSLYLKRKEFIVLFVVCITFLVGLPYVFEGGLYIFRIVDYYSATLSLFCLTFLEVISVSWMYGVRRFANNIEEMTGKRPNLYFIGSWLVVSPLIIIAITIFSFLQFKTFTLGSYVYKPWAVAIGWCLASLSLLCIPIGMIHTFVKAEGHTFKEKLYSSVKSPMAMTRSVFGASDNGELLSHLNVDNKVKNLGNRAQRLPDHETGDEM